MNPWSSVFVFMWPCGAGGWRGRMGGVALAEQRHFCERLRDADWEKTVALLNDARAITDTPRRRALRQLVLEKLALTNPARALEMMRAWHDGGYFNAFLTTLARLDPAALRTWAENTGDADFPGWADIAKDMEPDEIARLAKMFPRLTLNGIGGHRPESVLRQLATDDPAQAPATMDGLNEESGSHHYAAAAIGERWARRDLQAAHAWGQGTERSGATRVRLARRVGRVRRNRSPGRRRRQLEGKRHACRWPSDGAGCRSSA